jgi:Na+-driven multidrug efflux pump
MISQILVAIAETYFFGRLGTEALAGSALVYPFMMLMQMMASGGMGGGVAAAMARAVGGKRMEDARALVLHAFLLGVGVALLFTLLAWTVALRPCSGCSVGTGRPSLSLVAQKHPAAGPAVLGNPKVIAATVAYIAHVAPFYCLFGLGMALAAASQGAGRMQALLYAGIIRMVVATAGGWFAIERLGTGLDGVFVAIAAGIVLYAATLALPLLVKPWGAKRVRLASVTGASDGPHSDPPLDDRHLEPKSR